MRAVTYITRRWDTADGRANIWRWTAAVVVVGVYALAVRWLWSRDLVPSQPADVTAPWYRIRQQGEPDETLIPLAVAVALVAALPLVVRAARAVHTLRPWQPHSGGGYLARTPAPVPIPAASWSAFTQQLLLDRARSDSENARHRPGPGSVLRLPTPEPAPAGIEADRFQAETHTPPPAPEPEPQPEPEPAHNETYVEGTAWQDENSGEVLLTTSCNCPLSQHQRMVGQDWPTDPPDTQYADPPPSPPPTITDQLAAAETDLNLSPTETETDPPPSPPPTITDRLAAAVLEIAPDPDQPATPAAVWQGAASGQRGPRGCSGRGGRRGGRYPQGAAAAPVWGPVGGYAASESRLVGADSVPGRSHSVRGAPGVGHLQIVGQVPALAGPQSGLGHLGRPPVLAAR